MASSKTYTIGDDESGAQIIQEWFTGFYVSFITYICLCSKGKQTEDEPLDRCIPFSHLILYCLYLRVSLSPGVLYYFECSRKLEFCFIRKKKEKKAGNSGKL